MNHKKILSPVLAALLFFSAFPLVTANAAGFSEEEKYRRDLNRYVMMSNYENAIAIYRGDGSYPLSFSELIPQWWLTKISADPLFRKSEWPEACRKGLTYEAYLREGVAVGYRITACVESQKQKDTLTALGRPTDSMTVSGGDLSPKTVKRTFIDLLDTVETNSKITDASRNRMIREWEDESWLTSDQLVKVNAIAKKIEGMIAKKCWTRSSCRGKFEIALRAEAQKAAYGSEKRKLIETVAHVVSRKDWLWRTKQAYAPRKTEDRGTRDGSSAKPTGLPSPDATATTYPGCDTPDIALANGQIWAACNVGATKAYKTQALPSMNAPTAKEKAYLGSYFQWGRNDDVTDGPTTSTLAPAWTLAGGVGHTNFITALKDRDSIIQHSDVVNNDWLEVSNDNLWWGATTSESAGTFDDKDADDRKRIQGPCAYGYHVPTAKEWADAAESMSWSSNMSKNVLLLPMAGHRNSLHGDYVYHYYRGEDRVRIGTYWSSTPDKRTDMAHIYAITQYAPFKSSAVRREAHPVRCIKDSTQASIK